MRFSSQILHLFGISAQASVLKLASRVCLVKIIVPLLKIHDENVRIIKEELEYSGVSVIIASRECIQTASRKRRKEASEDHNSN